MRGEMERVSSETEIERVMMGLALSTSGTASQSPSPVPVLDLGAALGGDVGHVDLGVVAGADADLVRVALQKRPVDVVHGRQLCLPGWYGPCCCAAVRPSATNVLLNCFIMSTSSNSTSRSQGSWRRGAEMIETVKERQQQKWPLESEKTST